MTFENLKLQSGNDRMQAKTDDNVRGLGTKMSYPGLTVRTHVVRQELSKLDKMTNLEVAEWLLYSSVCHRSFWRLYCIHNLKSGK